MAIRPSEQISIRVMRILPSTFYQAKFHCTDIAESLIDYENPVINLTRTKNISKVEIDQMQSCYPNFSKEEVERSVHHSVPTDELILNQAFGTVYLGETFSFHLNLFNESNQVYKNVRLDVTMTCNDDEILLFPTINKSITTGIDLMPNTGINEIFKYDIKEVRQHDLCCSVSFVPIDNMVESAPPPVTVPVGQPKMDPGIPVKFQKNYNIQVYKPLEVCFQYDMINNTTILMQGKITNITTDTLYFERAVLETVSDQTGDVEDLNQDIFNENGELVQESIFGQMRLIKPQETVQFLYKMKRKNQDVISNPKVAFGKLDLAWRSVMGRFTRLQTAALRKNISISDLVLEVIEAPSHVRIYQAFQIKCQIFNQREKSLDLEMSVEPFSLELTKFGEGDSQSKTPGYLNVDTACFFWCGKTSRTIGEIKPLDKKELNFTLIPTKLGLQTLGGLRLIDYTAGFDEIFENMFQVLVEPDGPN